MEFCSCCPPRLECDGMGFLYVGQAGLELPASGDPPASASQSAGITGTVGTHVSERGDIPHKAMTSLAVSLCLPGWNAVELSRLTATSTSRVQAILSLSLRRSPYVTQAGPLGSSDLPASASQNAGITRMSHHAPPTINIIVLCCHYAHDIGKIEQAAHYHTELIKNANLPASCSSLRLTCPALPGERALQSSLLLGLHLQSGTLHINQCLFPITDLYPGLRWSLALSPVVVMARSHFTVTSVPYPRVQ
ncbi:Zinc finger protein 701, partial [Plecturocebus cupreus]